MSFLDSTGIGVVQSLRTRGRELNIDVYFGKPSAAVQRVLGAAGLIDLVE